MAAAAVFGNYTSDELHDDVMLPCQFLQRRRSDFPEAGLFVAILTSAIEDLRHVMRLLCPPRCKGCRRKREARAWIDGAPAPLSFAIICAGLELDPGQVRRRLARTQVAVGAVNRARAVHPVGLKRRRRELASVT
jgi:hypothetical protein